MTGPGTFLVVDDSRLHHQMFELVFRRPALAGAGLLHAYDGREGYTIFEARPDLTLVFLDLNMPHLTGLEFLERRLAEGLHLHIPVTLVTTESTADDEARGMAAGAWAYLRKPFVPEQVEQLVDRALKGSTAPIFT